MNKLIRTGVIGVGNMGQHHARIYGTMPGSHLVGVADNDNARAREIASRYEVPAYADYRVLLDQVEAVSIAAPTTLHYEIGIACLERGVYLHHVSPHHGFSSAHAMSDVEETLNVMEDAIELLG